MITKHKNSVLYLLWTPLILCQLGCFTVKNTNQFNYEKVSPAAYDSLLESTKNYVLIDVRTRKEFNRSHIDNAVNFSFLDFHFRKDVIHFDRQNTVFLYCQTCHRSPFAARKMKKMGFKIIYDLKGGYRRWKHKK